MNKKIAVTVIGGLVVAVGCMHSPIAGRHHAPPTAAITGQARPQRLERSFCGQVVRITDGDTIKVQDDRGPLWTVRLAEIDAPEKRQEFGPEARAALSNMIYGRMVIITPTARDRYGRIVGEVWLGTTCVNEKMVAGGYAWQYDQYSRDLEISNAEWMARQSKSGLWSNETACPPWRWRKDH